MSKAFLRESDEDESDPIAPRAVPLPFGVKNFLTEGGARRLRRQLASLQNQRRPLTGSSTADERRELQVLDGEIRRLDQSLRSAEVTSPPDPPWEIVRFGATAAVQDSTGAITRYRFVGVDETDPARNWVSWQSPIGRALLNRRKGETVTFAFPAGNAELTIIDITYESTISESAHLS